MIRFLHYLWPSRVPQHGYLSEWSLRYWLLRETRERAR